MFPGERLVGPEDEKWTEHRSQIMGLIRQCDPMPVLLIDNIADYVYEQHGFNHHLTLPNLAPPYAVFWTEFKPTAALKQLSSFMGTCQRVGVLAVATHRSETGEPQIHNSGDGWLLIKNFFADFGRDRIIGPHGDFCAEVDGAGVLKSMPCIGPIARTGDDEICRHLSSFLMPTLAAICFLNCKNVTTMEHAVDKPLADKYQKRTGVRPTKYRTLVIEPMKELLRTEGRIGEVGLERALHICRGHFATYTEGEGRKGLFGKSIFGQVWIPQHLRGVRKPDQQGTPPREIKFKLPEKK